MYIKIFLIAFALSLDAFSVAITCGIKLQTHKLLKYLKISFTFAAFQAFMPLLGILLGNLAKDYIQSFANWIAFFVFLTLSLHTFHDSKSNKCHSSESCNCSSNTCLYSLAVATSIDAFLIGIILPFIKVPLTHSIIIIGTVTFLMSLIACYIGNLANTVFKRFAKLIAALILLGLAISSLL